MADQVVEEELGVGSEMHPADGGEEKHLPHEEDLLGALRKFVLMSANPAPPHESVTKTGLRQRLVLLVVVLDIALLYLLFQEWFEDPLLLLILKVLPWLLGATVFTHYSETLQKRIVELCDRRFVAIIAIVFALPLLLLRQPIFSVLAKVNPDTATILPADETDKLEISQPHDDRVFRIVFPNLLKPYRITVEDLTTDQNRDPEEGYSRSYSPLLHRQQILQSSLAQIPIVGRIFGKREFESSPLYRLPLESEEGSTIQITGNFEKAYLEYLKQLPSDKRRCNQGSTIEGHEQILCRINGTDALYLPVGTYQFKLINAAGHACPSDKPLEITREKHDKIKLEKCSS